MKSLTCSQLAGWHKQQAKKFADIAGRDGVKEVTARQFDAKSRFHETSAAEIDRLLAICVKAHDAILAGAPDAELLAMLEGAWKQAPDEAAKCRR